MKKIIHETSIRFAALLLSKSAFNFWVWELTPLPIGYPSFGQYVSVIGIFWRELTN